MPGAGIDLIWIEHHLAIPTELIDLDKFFPRVTAGRVLKKQLHGMRAVDRNAQLLGKFTDRSGIIVFARIHVTRSRSRPDSRQLIFVHGALLQKKLTARIPDQYMHRAMAQPFSMHPTSGCLADDSVVLIHDVKEFLGIR